MHNAVPLTEPDREILAFAAEHRLVLERQVERLVGLGGPALRRRLKRLVGGEFLTDYELLGERHFQIRPLGLTAISSTLPAPKFKLRSYKHDVGLAWLWLAAHRGTFGPLKEVLSERHLRSHDGALEHPSEPYGVRLGGLDQYGNDRLHYPDLLLIAEDGRKLAMELELTSKSREKRELILGGYAADPRVDRVLYLMEDHRSGHAIMRTLELTARHMGLSEQIRFQLVKPLSVGRSEPQPSARAARRVEMTR